jgi:hypothetical protein
MGSRIAHSDGMLLNSFACWLGDEDSLTNA